MSDDGDDDDDGGGGGGGCCEEEEEEDRRARPLTDVRLALPLRLPLEYLARDACRVVWEGYVGVRDSLRVRDAIREFVKRFPTHRPSAPDLARARSAGAGLAGLAGLAGRKAGSPRTEEIVQKMRRVLLAYEEYVRGSCLEEVEVTKKAGERVRAEVCQLRADYERKKREARGREDRDDEDLVVWRETSETLEALVARHRRARDETRGGRRRPESLTSAVASLREDLAEESGEVGVRPLLPLVEAFQQELAGVERRVGKTVSQRLLCLVEMGGEE